MIAWRGRERIPASPSLQAEIFAGGFHSKQRRGEISHAVLALVGTIVGGGSLSIPWAIDKCGFALGIGLLVLFAAVSGLSVHLLLSAARRHGGLHSYDEVLRVAAGRWAEAVTILSVVLTTFLTLVANQLLLRQLLAPLAALVLSRTLTRWEAVALGCSAVALVVPLTFLSSLNSLRHVGLLSVTAVCTLVVLVIVNAGMCDPADYHNAGGHLHDDGGHLHLHDDDEGGWIAPGSPWDILSALPVFVCTYLCSFSALPIDVELRAPSRRRMNQSHTLCNKSQCIERSVHHSSCCTVCATGMNLYLKLAFGTSLVLYAAVGTAGIAYGRCRRKPIPSNLLNLFDAGDPSASVMRGLLSLVLLMSLPLICLPCRTMLHQLALLLAAACRPASGADDAGSSAHHSTASLPAASGSRDFRRSSLGAADLPFMTSFGEASPTNDGLRSTSPVGFLCSSGVSVPLSRSPDPPRPILPNLPPASLILPTSTSSLPHSATPACAPAGGSCNDLHARLLPASGVAASSSASWVTPAAATTHSAPSLARPIALPAAAVRAAPARGAGAAADAAAALAPPPPTFEATHAPNGCRLSHHASNGTLPSVASHADELSAATGGASGALGLGPRVLSSVAIMGLSMGLAAVLDEVTTVWGFLGSTAAVLLGLTFPCLAYVQLRQTPTTRASTVGQRKALAWVIVVGSLALIPACLLVATANVVQKQQ